MSPTLSSRTTGGGGLGTDHDLDGGLITEPALAMYLNAGAMGRLDAETETLLPVCVTGARTHSLTGEGFDASEDGTGRGPPIVTTCPQRIAPTLGCDYATKWGQNDQHINGGAGLFGPFDTTQVTSKTNRSQPRPGSPCHPLASRAHPPAIAFHLTQDPISGATTPAMSQGNRTGCATLGVAPHGGTVRRLTPMECERLQGFPDNYTNIPGARNSPRYKALGNSMAVPVMRWLGERIQMVEDGAMW